ncbi:MAG TPA: PH domain-containing protein [Thermoanaerobaculia bacterium]|nr:PH domain-containing protein [Thermoanaerobaculia bacterium]
MPSDRRLHPLSILFGLAAQIRSFAIPAIPGLAVLVTAGATGWNWWDWEAWPLWMMPLLIPYAIVTIGRYLSFRYRYEPNEMVIRTGFIFRNERHVPYARIQNLDAVQNVFHRLLGVVEVRVETGGGGQEPEAKMSVLPVAAFEEMKRRVFAGRGGEGAPAEVAADATTQGRTLLHLPLRELVLSGLIQNRGAVVIAAGFGLLWEVGLMDGFMDRFFDERTFGRGVVRDVLRAVFGQGGFPLGRIGLTLAALAGLLLFIRLISMVLALVRLYGFRLTRDGEDLRTEFGLLTRVVTSIPPRRIQTLTILEGPLHQLFRRVSVRAETAGGAGGEEGEGSKRQREWLAPILHRDALPDFVHELLPELDLTGVAWNPAHPRAFRRAFKGSIIFAVLVSLPFVLLLKWWDLALLAVLLAWGFVATRIYVAHLGWAVTDSAVLFRTGWIWRKITVVRFTKIQAVAIHESPFDRRNAMARVRVDTAGAGERSHRVDIPYLARETARNLCNLLATQAARTAFRW